MMTLLNLIENKNMNNSIKTNSTNCSFSLIKKYGIDVSLIEIISKIDIQFSFYEKSVILEKLLEAHELAKINVDVGNITKRGFASNVCTYDNIWALGTNFNNTRNEISSVCGERSAILAAYNASLLNYLKNNSDSIDFNFKVKYICMAQALDLFKIDKSIIPCEDCLAWFNTSKYFDDDTIIFSFEKHRGNLCLRAISLSELLPFRNKKTSVEYLESKKIICSDFALNSMRMNSIDEEKIYELVSIAYGKYKENDMTELSNQNIACSIFANGNIYTSNKIDWTKRWYSEPLIHCFYDAVVENAENTRVDAICYFGDEYTKNNDEFNDGVVSIKSIGRIRQKFATNDTLIILNFKDYIQVTTIGEYLPMKFIQGYKI